MDTRELSRDFHQKIIAAYDKGEDFAVAVVLKTQGSTPCKAGSKAVITSVGDIEGTIGGGLVEAEAKRRATQVISTGRPVVFDFPLEGGSVSGGKPICGGTMRVLIHPNATSFRPAYEEAVRIKQRRARGVLFTTLRGAAQSELTVECLPNSTTVRQIDFPDSNTIDMVLKQEEPRLLVREPAPSSERLEAFMEPLIPRPLLLIVGGGHVGQAVAAQASLVGFEIIVLDDRADFTEPSLFPAGVTARCGNIVEELTAIPFNQDTFVALVTRGPQYDAAALELCLRKPTAYVGMIGSRRKVAIVRKEFLESGRATAAEFARVYAPIGLDIGAVTVPEIATSIVAQLISVRRTATAQRMAAILVP